jgi:acetyl-CoA carboxylase biotin carboxyl carrier protein
MSDSKPTSSDVFDVERIRRLVELMKEHDLREIDLCESEQKIRIARGPAGAPVVYPSMPAPVAAAAQSTPAASAAGPVDGPNIVIIKSPMVGTYYSKPNPKAEAFVKVGDFVEPNSTVCVIEAMKVFNDIQAEVRGKIVAILVESEEPVDFGKPLFKVDTSK